MSSSNAQSRASKKRPYRLGERARKQEETRRRIVEAAVELHCTVGPARTTVAQIAERAGVQRHTYYAHFPDEWQLLLACSSLALERDPLPQPEEWERLAPGYERLRHALEQLYGWYARNTGQASCVLRDAEIHPPTRRIVELRMGPLFRRGAELLAVGVDAARLGLIHVALDFNCWRVLSVSHDPSAAAHLLATAIAYSGETPQPKAEPMARSGRSAQT